MTPGGVIQHAGVLFPGDEIDITTIFYQGRAIVTAIDVQDDSCVVIECRSRHRVPDTIGQLGFVSFQFTCTPGTVGYPVH